MKNHRNTGIFRERSEELFKMLIFERVQIFKMVDDWWKSRSGKCVSSQTKFVGSFEARDRKMHSARSRMHPRCYSKAFRKHMLRFTVLCIDVALKGCYKLHDNWPCLFLKSRPELSRDQRVFRLRILEFLSQSSVCLQISMILFRIKWEF